MIARLPGILLLASLLVVNPWALREFSTDHELLPATVRNIYALDGLILVLGALALWQGPRLSRRWAFLTPAARAWIVGTGAAGLWLFLVLLHFLTLRTRFARLFHTGIEGSIPSIYSVLLFAAASLVAWQLGARRRRVALASLTLFYLALDEGFEFHERLYTWQALLIWGVLGAVLFVSLWPTLRVRWPIALCAAFVLLGLGLDLGGTHWLEARLPLAEGRLWRVLEDSFEVLASSTLLGLLSFQKSLQKAGRLSVMPRSAGSVP